MSNKFLYPLPTIRFVTPENSVVLLTVTRYKLQYTQTYINIRFLMIFGLQFRQC